MTKIPAEEEAGTVIRVGWRILIFGISAILLAAAASAGIMAVVAMVAIKQERSVSLELVASNRLFRDCLIDRAKSQERVKVWEALFISANETAIDRAAQHFLDANPDKTADQMTIGQFRDWLSTR